MGRGPKPAKGKAKPTVPRKSRTNEDSKVRDLEKHLAESLEQLQTRDRELAESQEQQTATAEILQVMRRSPADTQPVFDAVAESAARLCASLDAHVFVREGDLLRLVGHHGSIPIDQTLPLIRGTANGRAVLDGRTVHLVDIQVEVNELPEGSEIARRLGHRTVLIVPLMREGIAIGTISLRRTEARSFTEPQVALLQTFADQAVIAIENVRLFTELQEKNKALTVAHAQVTESLERQTATSEILRVIASSPTDVQPVFDTIATSAGRLCGAESAVVYRIQDEVADVVALYNLNPDAIQAYHQRFPRRLRDTDYLWRVADGAVLNIADIAEDPDSATNASFRARNVRSIIEVPMVRGGQAIGAISVSHHGVGAFSDERVRLLQTFADQAVIAIENVRLFTELEARNHDLTRALDRETATSEILRVISSSPTDVQPVFDAIVRSAVTLCGAILGAIYRRDGGQVCLVGLDPRYPHAEEVRATYPAPVTSTLMSCRAIQENAIIQLPDTETPGVLPPEGLRLAQLSGFRSVVAVPMRRESEPIGAILVGRPAVGAFPDEQIGLLQAFADQAVIAIENVRLFRELQEKNRALTTAHARVTEALDQQTATSEILRVISQSPTDVQPVFDAIVESAVRLCGGRFAAGWRYDGEQIHFVAHHNVPPAALERNRRAFPMPPDRAGIVGRAVIDRAVVHIADVESDPSAEPGLREMARMIGYRNTICVPMLKDGRAVGAISVARETAGPFFDKQIALLQTFADQAVIAIENVRLFSDLQASNRDLTRTLEQQTSTSEILRVISRSPTTVEPVFQAIVASGRRLCHAHQCLLVGFDGEMLTWLASDNFSPSREDALRSIFPYRPTRAGTTGRVVLDRDVVHIPDVMEEADHAFKDVSMKAGARAQLAVPLFRQNDVIGALHVARPEPGPFSDDEIALLKTFADQAVIAIENFRLFKELEARTQALTRSVDELTALGEVNRALSSTLDVDVVLNTIVTRANDLIGADGCTIFEYDEVTEQFHLRATRDLDPRLVELARGTPLRKGDQGILGQLPMGGQAVQVTDITAGSYSSPISDALIQAGYRAVLAVPLIREDHLIGALTMNRKRPGEFSAETIELLQTFATQSALAIQNARLFREIEDKSHQLEVASQHKSEFLANMSHELRTPLNAIIGFSEVLADRMFGELNEKQEEYLKDIYASGTHLLSLINDILDLSKIEAGRMELELTDFDLPTAIDSAVMLVRERAARRNIALHTAMDPQLGQIQADERKVRQVVLNLLSNAIKFTPEGGRIDVGAVSKDAFMEVSVTDTGIGIAPEDQEKVFEEFRQVGAAAKKVEGTGLGLTLCRKFVELHGGRIWVKSQLGAGSTFTFMVPVRLQLERRP
jgi:GAF domain-containing protein